VSDIEKVSNFSPFVHYVSPIPAALSAVNFLLPLPTQVVAEDVMCGI
jgi:hypothetical protein